MKNLFKPILVQGKYLFALLSLIFTLPVLAQPDDLCTPDMFSSGNVLRLQKPIDSTVTQIGTPTANPFFKTYDPCERNGNNTRAVGFIHGLGGSIAAWDKQIRYTDSAYNTACFGVDYGSGNHEVSFLAVGQKLKNDLSDGFDNVDETHNLIHATPRCHYDDYVIAHSQGGIAARYLDMKWNNNRQGSFGGREFYGLVTFGTPHAGAHIALTKAEHYGFVSDVISTVILYKVNEEIYDFTGRFPGTFFSSGVYDFKKRLDTLIKNELAPLMLSSVHTPTLDEMSPGSYTMTSVNNHWGSLHRVAFYGIEDAPECWRVMDQVVTKTSDEYPLWGAQPDEEFKNKMEEVRGLHTLKIQENNDYINHKRSWRNATLWLAAPFVNGQIVAKRLENEKREKSVEFLNNANTQWRYLIGSYHRDSFETTVKSTYFVTYLFSASPGFNGRLTKSHNFSNQADAQAYAAKVFGQVHHIKTVTKVLKFYPSDGVVLAHSQKAFPGIKDSDVDIMPHNNHFQERNSLETRRVLNNLYKGRHYDKYFQLSH